MEEVSRKELRGIAGVVLTLRNPWEVSRKELRADEPRTARDTSLGSIQEGIERGNHAYTGDVRAMIRSIQEGIESPPRPRYRQLVAAWKYPARN